MQKQKKVISLVLAMVLALSCFACLGSVSAFAAETDEASLQLGDVNADGRVSVDDVTELQLYLAHRAELSPAQLKAADTNLDGEVSIDDVTTIQLWLAHRATPGEPTQDQTGDQPEPTTVEPTTVEPTTVEPVTEPTQDEAKTYSLAGDPAAIFGASWDAANTSTDMTKGEDGNYSITFTDVEPVQNAQFKVVVNHSWDENYGINGNNVVFNVTETTDVTITFNPETKEITVTGAELPQDLEIEAMRAVGNGEDTWLNGIAWNPAADENLMTEVADGIYEIVIEDVPAFDNWQLKFAANGDWTNNWGYAKDAENAYVVGETVDAAFDGANIIVEVEEDGSTVKAQLDLREFDFASKTGAKFTITVTAPGQDEPTQDEAKAYSLAGDPAAIFGASWDAANTSTDMTKGEDGNYTITFTDVEPVQNAQFKVVVNHSWDENYGKDGNNFVFNVTETSDVTVTFNPETKEITVTGEGVEIPESLEIEAMRAVGNGEDTWLNGIAWNPAADENLMTEVADGIYEIVMEDVFAYDNWQIKFAANGDWTNNWGYAKDAENAYVVGETADAAFDGANIIVAVEEDGSTVKAQLDLRDFDFASKTGAKFTITVTAPGQDEPTEPTQDEPTEPTQDEPTEPTQDEPTEPTQDEPTEPTQDEPTEPTQDEPTESTPDEPTESTPDEPADATPDEPAPAAQNDSADQAGKVVNAVGVIFKSLFANI